MDVLESCTLCPRNCHINRYKTVGVCGASEKIKVAHHGLHMWEEPIISGDAGSGTIFFSYCNLKCIFCQNYKISTGGYGKEISQERLQELCLDLQEKGANNINLVTPTHYVPQIVSSIHKIKGKELKIPIVYNTSSYENTSTIQMLDGIVDIYLADLKYFDDNLACQYSHVKDYFHYATMAIDEMVKQVGKFVIKNDLMTRGVIVRILILPGHADDAKKLVQYLYNAYKDNIIISLMNQYTPLKHFDDFPNLNYKVSDEEYQDVIDFALDLGVKYAFIQEGETQSESFIPNFNCSDI
ncbi:MAG: radical SAM protein [bacterium]|nr:radical SAM protein [Mycoplasmatota bacterium]MDD6756438.1 radical SAM protein [bacterium]MDY2908144.1 radical SAM protein [Candidatus Faecimonas sp.]